MKRKANKILAGILLAGYGLASCSESHVIDRTRDIEPPIFPDYAGVTVPYNIAPLHFKLADSCVHEQAYATFEMGARRVTVKEKRNRFAISCAAWKKLMNGAAGQTVHVTVTVKADGKWIRYAPFRCFVANEPADPYIVYRLIEPGYEVWNEMGIYQRRLEDFREKAIITNRMTAYGCMNCHSFCMQQPGKMLLHLRETFPCTVLIDGNGIEKLNTGTQETLSAFVYPSWHPSGKYVAFSVNNTKQMFHANNPNRIEVFDLASDVVVYDVEKHEIVTAPALCSKHAFETYPTFSPDGRTLFFCTADTSNMPHEYARVKYSLCSVAFDPVQRRFGQVDTLYRASSLNASASFPRVSPDGRFLMFTLSACGCFPIWHRDADLYLLNLTNRRITPLDPLNSPETESYHSWSSNSRWVVFSSRRMDGLYTHPYLAYMDADGTASKPFPLPQDDAEFYRRFMRSFNIPEFVTGKVQTQGYTISRTVKHEKGTDVTFAGNRPQE
jgi:hypothetical protein